jgi:hypothetical protein
MIIQGTGMRLAVAKAIVELYVGRLESRANWAEDHSSISPCLRLDLGPHLPPHRQLQSPAYLNRAKH